MTAAATLPTDAQLPQLARALDTAAMGEAFDTALRGPSGQRVLACRMERVKYRPRLNCTVSWVLEMQDEGGGSPYPQRVAGRFCGVGEAAPRHARNRTRVARDTRCGRSALLLPGLELFAWFVPNDPKLAALAPLCDTLREHGAPLGQAVEALLGQAAPARVSAELIRYVPESRACARFDVVPQDSPGVRRLFVKVDRDRAGGAIHALMQVLHASPAQAEGRLVTPRPLLWQADTGMHWQEAVAGQALADLPPQRRWALAPQVGALLAALHGTPVPALREVGGDQLVDWPCACAMQMAEVEPAWAPRLQAILARLEDGAEFARGLPQVTLHGDLHPRNLLADGNRLALIDLDAACSGPAVLDLGAWIADTLFRALHAGTPLAPEQCAAAQLLQAYEAAARQPIPAPLLAWAVARALLCERAYRCVANLKPGCFALVPAVLALAESVARRGVFDRCLDPT